MSTLYKVRKEDDAINRVLNKCAAAIEAGRTAYRGMIYEQGIEDGIQWLVGNREDEPLEEVELEEDE